MNEDARRKNSGIKTVVRSVGPSVCIVVGRGSRARRRTCSGFAVAMDLWRLGTSRSPVLAFADLVLDEAADVIANLIQ